MTWKNLPCAPTLPALFAACPHGWAEIEFTYQRGNPTADPPQDADCSMEVRRLWGIENADEPALVDLLEDLGEPPLGMPHRDCILLARMEYHAGLCGTCMREPDDEHRPGDPCPRGECGGEFSTEPRLTACWGVDDKPVVFVGATAEYGPSAALDREDATTAAESTAPASMRDLLLKAALLREKRAYPNVETFAARLLVEVFDLDADDERLDLDDDDTDVLADLVADLDNATVEFARTWNED